MRTLSPAVHYGLLACLALLSACQQVGRGPSDKLTVHYGFASTDGEATTAGIKSDSDIRSVGVSYEFIPLPPSGTLGISFMRRSDEPVILGPNQDLDSDILALNLRQYFKLDESVRWFLGGALGWVVGVDGPPGTSYDGSFFYGMDAGVDWTLAHNFGIELGANWYEFEAQGAGFTPDTDVGGFGFFAGVFVEFGR